MAFFVTSCFVQQKLDYNRFEIWNVNQDFDPSAFYFVKEEDSIDPSLFLTGLRAEIITKDEKKCIWTRDNN